MGITMLSCCCPGWASPDRLLEGQSKWGCWIFCGHSNWHFWGWGLTSFWLFWWVHRLKGFWRCCVQHGTGISSHHEKLLFFILGFSRYCVTSRSWGRGDLSAWWDWCQGMAVPAHDTHDMVSSRWSITVLCTLLLGPFPWAGTTVYTAHADPGVSWTLYKLGSQASWILLWPWGLLRI